MNNKEFAEKCIDVAKNYKTLYVNGCFGSPLTPANKKRFSENTAYNRQPERKKKIMAADTNTFGFDCVCFIKGILWGWDGNICDQYGGAKYKSNGVPDITENSMIKKCSDVSTEFNTKTMEIGEVVWMDGHIGVYIGNGLAVECSPKWKDGVQITAVNYWKLGYNTRKWTKHGKLPYISYSKTIDELAKEVIDGKWGSGSARKKALTAAGYDYAAVQKRVNELLK